MTEGRSRPGDTPPCAELLPGLLDLTRRRLRVFVQRPDPAWFERGDTPARLQALFTQHPNNRLQICVRDAAGLLQDCPRLVELVRRLPSRCALRVAAPEHREIIESYALGDDHSYLLQPEHWNPHCVLRTQDPAGAHRLVESFEAVWARAEPDPELRALHL